MGKLKNIPLLPLSPDGVIITLQERMGEEAEYEIEEADCRIVDSCYGNYAIYGRFGGQEVRCGEQETGGGG